MEDLQFDDDSYDLVTCCLGLMYVDRAEALPEIFRVCKPEGSVLAAVHASESDYHVPFEAAVRAVLGDAADDHEAVPASMGVRPLSLGEEGVLKGELLAAGFEDVRCEPFDFAIRAAGSPDEAWGRVKSPLVHLLEVLQEQGVVPGGVDVEGRAREAYEEALRGAGGLGEGGFEFPRNRAWIYTGNKPREKGGWW